MRKSTAHTPPAGQLLDLGAELAAALHADGRLTLTDAEGAAAELDPQQVEQLAALLALGAALRSQARRRRARAAYLATYAPDALA